MKKLDSNNPKTRIEHIVVVSYDAFSVTDWEYASSLPNLGKLKASGSYTTDLKSVYPSLTYVVHSTIVTGCYPDKHRVYNNNPLQPFVAEQDQDWHWYRKDIKIPTIYDLVQDNGGITAGILWPVTGKANIKYNLPELAAVRGENQILKVLRNGNPFFCIEMELKHGNTRSGVNQPELDDFSTKCACDTVKRRKPNLLLVHLIDLDDAKHKFGINGPEARAAIDRMDIRLGDIIESIEESGKSSRTAIVILGDHGQLNVQYKVHLNNLLMDGGLIKNTNGNYQWRAYLQAGGGSAFLHINGDDPEAEREALKILNNALEDGSCGIESILGRRDLDELRVPDEYRWMIEAKEGYSFEEAIHSRLIEDLSIENIRHANHGYLPDKKNYTCNFIAAGPGIKKDFEFGLMNMVDIAPTLAAMIGLRMKDTDGNVIDEIFE